MFTPSSETTDMMGSSAFDCVVLCLLLIICSLLIWVQSIVMWLNRTKDKRSKTGRGGARRMGLCF